MFDKTAIVEENKAMSTENRISGRLAGILLVTFIASGAAYGYKVSTYEPYEPDQVKPTQTSGEHAPLQGRPYDLKDLSATLRGDLQPKTWEQIVPVRIHRDTVVLHSDIGGIIPEGTETTALLTYVDDPENSNPLGIAVMDCADAQFLSDSKTEDIVIPEACVVPIQNVGILHSGSTASK